MLVTQAALFRLASARMNWLGQRQVVLNENIANADTPDYQPRDLRPGDFARLAQGAGPRQSQLAMIRTDGAHLDGPPPARIGLRPAEGESRYETAPDGNAVVLEEQMAKAAQTALDYQLTTNLYKKYLGMVRIALGTQS